MDIQHLFQPCLLIWVSVNIAMNLAVFLLWDKKFNLKWGLQKYQAIQRIHLHETPRLGGVIFLICLLGYAFTCDMSDSQNTLKMLAIVTIPAAIVALKEDLTHNVEPAIRLMALLFSGWLFRALYLGAYPDMSAVPVIHDLLLFQGGISFFYILATVSVANGMNLIDGVNGLCAVVAFTVLATLLFLAHMTNDGVMQLTCLTLILLLLPFTAFNFPLGFIFLGDVGAYVLGILLSCLSIVFFGRHPELSPWNAAVALLYPATEVIFTVLRRLISGYSIYRPDRHHLHLKLFYFLRPRHPFKKIAGALVTPILAMLWLFPLLSVVVFYRHPSVLIASILTFWTIYVALFFSLPKAPNHFDHRD
jgi:UDP-N-acetylmuramyl pentapeptide phosphotransferase/UDP-N-acetylglucosamine-1-phosphate transferase